VFEAVLANRQLHPRGMPTVLLQAVVGVEPLFLATIKEGGREAL